MRKCSFLIVLFIFAAISANAQSSDLQEEIEETSQKVGEALDNGDFGTFAMYFDDDVTMKMPGHETLKGVDAVVAAHKPMAEQKIKLVLDTDEVIDLNGYAYESGNYKIQTADGKVVDKGSFGTLWKKENGTWKIFRDMVSTTMPINAQDH
ncbi:hypothetical protein C7S20_11745 [Christiangramia fulva]|uniref:DUF4440 domain-containing protein n=1 Tax=Christiangramia fulva TaxID=2126553 RepID=A0A2R3Z6I5_9FLAO|nr:nuclear transport factor 2 family protein [Christiangramia fulva]AVR45870.1 hypothetical protein C7S20_11745 [Christiangramia fulva]